jgi:hypothetical protein
MKEHQQKHKLGLMTESGVSTDPEQIKRSRRRVRKWRDSLGTRSARRRE